MSDDEDPPAESPDKLEKKKDSDGDDDASVIEPEVLEKLPPEVRRVLEFGMGMFSTPVFHPVTKKINEGHIDKLLDSSEKDSQREYKDRMWGRCFGILYALIGVGLFVFVTMYLSDDKELYRDLLTKVIIFFGGGGLGYGVKAFLDRE
jgi:hypothetical protein